MIKVGVYYTHKQHVFSLKNAIYVHNIFITNHTWYNKSYMVNCYQLLLVNKKVISMVRVKLELITTDHL